MIIASQHEKRFQPRAFVALGATVTGLALPVSGVADHLLQESPSPALDVWSAVHWSCGILCIGFVVGHVMLNRRAYRRYLRDLAARLPLLSREILAVVAVLVVALGPAVGHTVLA